MFNFRSSDDLGKTLSLLWLFAILNVVFRDIHELTTASAIQEITSGYVNGNPITEGVLLAAGFAVELLLLAFLLSSLLAPKAARILNLALAPLAIVGIFLAPPNDPDDYFFATVVAGTFLAIFVLAWNWKLAAHSDRYDREHNVR